MNQSIRIIGGLYRGKKLHFPNINGLRPTPDRVRETLFNWLMHDIKNSRCLDAFAGSGALGFEAMSRGATSVVLIEQERMAFLNLKKTCSSFASKNLSILQMDALDYLKQQALTNKEPFDIIFLDPPFANKQLLLDCINTLTQSNILKNEGMLYIESADEITLDPLVWESIKIKKTGNVVYALYKNKKI